MCQQSPTYKYGTSISGENPPPAADEDEIIPGLPRHEDYGQGLYTGSEDDIPGLVPKTSVIDRRYSSALTIITMIGIGDGHPFPLQGVYVGRLQGVYRGSSQEAYELRPLQRGLGGCRGLVYGRVGPFVATMLYPCRKDCDSTGGGGGGA